MNRSLTRFFNLLIVLLTVLSSLPAMAETANNDIVVGSRLFLTSEVLGEEREILVSLPAEYVQNDHRYPVLYVLDGRAHFLHVSGLVRFLAGAGIAPLMIVVALPNVDRNRDFTPFLGDPVPNRGGADSFLTFFEKELFPFVENHFRTQPYRILAGHSLGGLFVVHTLLNRPDLFDGLIASSPWLVYHEKGYVGRLEPLLKAHPGFHHTFYMSLGREGEEIEESLAYLDNLLKKTGSEGLRWNYDFMANEDHRTIPHLAFYRGLEFIFDGWRLRENYDELGLEGILNHYEELSRRFGYTITVPEQTLNQMGYQLIARGNLNEAIKVFRKNVDLYPDSANVYDSLGEALERSGDLNLARWNYIHAVKNGEKINDPNLKVYNTNLRRVTEKLSGESEIRETGESIKPERYR